MVKVLTYNKFKGTYHIDWGAKVAIYSSCSQECTAGVL